MVNFLRKLFIKDYNNVKDPKVREKHGKLASFVGVFSNLFLFIIKLFAGILSGSIAIIADSINNLSDMGSSIITLVGFKLANAPADDDHPYGHQRIEYISGLIVSIIIIFVGGNLLLTSIEKIMNYTPEVVENTTLYISMGILGVSILIKLWQSIFNKKVGKIINSLALEATSADSRNDCISTLVILLGNIALLIWKDIPFSLDGVLGILVSLFIIIAGINLIKETVDPLIGVSVESEFVKNIVEDIKKNEVVLGLHDLVCHMYGPTKCFMTIHVEVDSKADLMATHDAIDNIEKDIFMNHGVYLTIHMDPIETDNEEVNNLRKIVSETIHNIDSVLNIHDFRVVYGDTHTNILFDVSMPINFSCTPKELREIITTEIKKINENYFVIIQIDQLYNRKA